MGEIVQKQMERFTPALMELKESNIFKEEELSKMLNKIRKIEDKMASGAKNIDYYKSAVHYYKNLLRELRRRKKDNHALRKNNKRLDWIFIKKIVDTYKRGLKYFSGDYGFNLEFFYFLQGFQEEYQNITSDHVKKMIQTFTHEPDVFKKGAGWFLQLDKVDEARSILLRGQALHPKKLEIYLDLIELEIKNVTAKGIQSRLKKMVEEIVRNKITHRFLQEVVIIFDNYDNLKGVVDFALEQLLTEYKNEDGVWQFIALRELKGDYYPSGDEEKKTTMYSIERAVKRFKEGFGKIASDKRPQLWRKYLDMLVDVQKQCRNQQTVSFLREALDDALAEKVETDDSHYMAWMDFCENNHALLVKKFEEGVKEHTTSATLWTLYLRYYLLQDQSEFAKQVFDRAVPALGVDSARLWELYLEFHLLKSPVVEVDALYERAINQPHPEISALFKPRYLAWTIVSRGIEHGRELYQDIAKKPPFSKELHLEMLLAEQTEQSKPSTSQLVIDLWLKQFGHEDLEVYFYMIDLAHQEGGLEVNEKIRHVYDQAIRTLADDDKVREFKSRFDRLEKP